MKITNFKSKVILKSRRIWQVSILILCLFSGLALAAQVSGVVRDEDNQLLPSVSVIVKETSMGIIPNADGKYIINAPTQEVNLNNRNIVHVILTSDEKALSDVVVVGYGFPEKTSLTGTVADVLR